MRQQKKQKVADQTYEYLLKQQENIGKQQRNKSCEQKIWGTKGNNLRLKNRTAGRKSKKLWKLYKTASLKIRENAEKNSKMKAVKGKETQNRIIKH